MMKVQLMDGTCPRCIIDNTSAIVAHGAGTDPVMAQEMEGFGLIFEVIFEAHEVDGCNRKGRVEPPFSYIEGNFLVERTFLDWDDLNRQAAQWCQPEYPPAATRAYIEQHADELRSEGKNPEELLRAVRSAPEAGSILRRFWKLVRGTIESPQVNAGHTWGDSRRPDWDER